MRSISFSMGVAASSAPISATRPLPKAAWMSRDRLRPHGEVLVGPVRVAHADVVDDVGPLPAALAGDGRGAVAEVLEDRGQARAGEPLVARGQVRVADPLVLLGDVVRGHLEVVVERDRRVGREQAPGAVLLGLADVHHERRHPIGLGRESEGAVVAPASS